MNNKIAITKQKKQKKQKQDLSKIQQDYYFFLLIARERC